MDFTGLDAGVLHPALATLIRYADEIEGNGQLPSRSAYNPLHIAPIVGHIFLIDVLDDGRDYYFSQFGPRIAVLFGTNLEGLKLSEVGDALLRQSLRHTYDRVVTTHLPLYMRGRYVWFDKSISIERLLIPMADDDGCLNTICGVSQPIGIPDSDLERYVGEGPAQLVGDDELVLPAA